MSDDLRPTGAVTHLAGPRVQIGGDVNRPWLRQRCSWCGAVLVDYDLQRTAVAVEPGEEPSLPAAWAAGAWVTIDGHASWDEGDGFDETVPTPLTACTRLDPEVTA